MWNYCLLERLLLESQRWWMKASACVEMIQISAIVLTRTVPRTTVLLIDELYQSLELSFKTMKLIILWDSLVWFVRAFKTVWQDFFNWYITGSSHSLWNEVMFVESMENVKEDKLTFLSINRYKNIKKTSTCRKFLGDKTHTIACIFKWTGACKHSFSNFPSISNL